MTWQAAEGVLKIAFDPLFTMTIAAVFFTIGMTLRRNVSFLSCFCIPAAVIGGLILGFITLGMRYHGGVSLSFDTALQTPMMLAFFTTIGMSGNFAILKRCSPTLIIYLAACWGVAIFQNVFGVLLAKVFGVHAALGVMAGSVSLEGAHDAAVVFGPMAEGLGVAEAGVVAVASATFGQIAGGLTGGPLASWLIRSVKLEPAVSAEAKPLQPMESFDLFRALTIVMVVMTAGSLVSNWKWGGLSLPGYMGAMFVAIVFRNINDALGLFKIHERAIGLISDISVGMFLIMSMMSLRIWDLYRLATPIAAMLLLQTAAIALLAIFVCFPILGKDYDAAIMCAGFMGHGLGAMPNAVSNMNSVCNRYGAMSYRAFLIVPLCCAVLVDIVAIPNIVWFINYFTH
ncbi:glutamate/sodium ion symporter GltS [Synergistales bacterium]|nr:glutamate/sodium ion symporter GltS [Synergistales bacterium]